MSLLNKKEFLFAEGCGSPRKAACKCRRQYTVYNVFFKWRSPRSKRLAWLAGLAAGGTAIWIASRSSCEGALIQHVTAEDIVTSPVSDGVKTEVAPAYSLARQLLAFHKEHHTVHKPAYIACAERIISILHRKREEVGAPGLSYAISIDGEKVLSGGMGFADVENGVACSERTVFRVASISKALTAAAIARCVEGGQLDLDAPIQKYVPEFPEKSFNGATVSITTKQLMSHTSGIRGYFRDRDAQGNKSPPEDSKERILDDIESTRKAESEIRENYVKEHYPSVESGLFMFKDDPLLYEPGTDYTYSTHGYTLLSRVLEKVTNEPFAKHMNRMLSDLGMSSTQVDDNQKIIANRSRNYVRDERGHLRNAPYVDNSYKWAGGGFLSTAVDLVKFANIMLASYQCAPGLGRRFLSRDTMRMLWTCNPVTIGKSLPGVGVGLTWFLQADQEKFLGGENKDFIVYHTGGAVGASSILLIHPTSPGWSEDDRMPKGVAVCILVNVHKAEGLTNAALEIVSCIKEIKNEIGAE